MKQDRRQQIAFEAARLLQQGIETDYPRAKRRAARRIGLRFRPDDLPSNREVREHLDHLTEVANANRVTPRQLQIETLRVLRALDRFHPRLVGSSAAEAFEGRCVSDIVVTARDVDAVMQSLRAENFTPRPEPPTRPNAPAVLRIDGPLSFRIAVFKPGDPPASPVLVPCDQFEQALVEQSADPSECDLDAELAGLVPDADRFEVYRVALAQLEDVSQDPRRHPEGDALYHSLQMYDLALAERRYDEEFLTAALLHDVGKSIDERDHVAAALELLEGLITHRTRFLIEHLHDARLAKRSALPAAKRHQLETSPEWQDVLILAEFDEQARASGVETTSLDNAIEHLRRLDAGIHPVEPTNGEGDE